MRYVDARNVGVLSKSDIETVPLIFDLSFREDAHNDALEEIMRHSTVVMIIPMYNIKIFFFKFILKLCEGL